MLKRIFATALCFSFLACSMTACGKEVELKESSDSQSSSVSADLQAGEYVNFTAPEKGEQIVIMTIKDMGDIKIKLFPELAPTGVKNFVELAKQGYYDELIFHRVISNFMIQGGDPKGNGTGGSPAEGITFEAGDASPYLTHVSGAVAYANSGSTATNGSQFSILLPAKSMMKTRFHRWNRLTEKLIPIHSRKCTVKSEELHGLTEAIQYSVRFLTVLI